MKNLIKHLQDRHLCAQYSDMAGIEELFSKNKLVIYHGIDPTAGSLHIGNLVPLRQIKVLVENGQQCILLLGEGTTHIGDPSGKTETRKLLQKEQIAKNRKRLESQIRALMKAWNCEVSFANNADWLLDLQYIDFLREIGSHFSVNRMLSFESYRQRMEKGLSFIEFNYQLLQAYDYYVLHQKHGVNLQVGGDDQWGNIVAGIDLIRRKTSDQVYAMTVPLLTTASGSKMGKTERGSVYLDADMTSVFEFFQYWRNVADSDVEKLMRIYTDYSVEEIQSLTNVTGSAINEAKKQLASAVTAYVHGEEKTQELLQSIDSIYTGDGSSVSQIPSKEVSLAYVQKHLPLVSVYVEVGLCKSTSEARRFIAQGGLYLNGNKVSSHTTVLDETAVVDGKVHLQVGKKRIAILRIV